MCEENISILLKWINDIEQRISKIGGPEEHFEDLQSQINVLKVRSVKFLRNRGLFFSKKLYEAKSALKLIIFQ